MTDDELKVGAKVDGFEIQSRGRTTARLINALCDLGSPFTESAGLLGDMVRTYREENAVRALQRVRAISHKAGKNLNPPAAKFTVDWIEGVSLEEDDVLVEMWANLFVSEAENKARSHFLYKRFLKEITKSEAELLQRLRKHGESSDVYRFPDDAEFVWKHLENDPKGLFFVDFSYSDEAKLESYLKQKVEKAGLKIQEFSVYRFDENPNWGLEAIIEPHATNGFVHTTDDWASLDMLSAQGLIERTEKRLIRRAEIEPSGENLVLEITGCYLTQVGCGFLDAVDPHEQVAAG
ncbi:Abi-alpha family protein [Marivita hallyeonensis]|uniref:DUF4393 domain-containing protein n=1 Tax=Marivita hallyeonensis TaxID=996342 RepID=A0A1M5RRX8_9RHOB|nr:Abi-alpha family protein [Marivita hallyeonensis]SHH29024.1 protein of unknown function [Marivita hallyeonensis]